MDRRAIEAVVTTLGGSFKGQKLDDVPLVAVATWLGIEHAELTDSRLLAGRIRVAIVRAVEGQLQLTGEVRDGVTLHDLWQQLAVQERSRSRVADDLGLDPKTVHVHFRERIVPEVASILLRDHAELVGTSAGGRLDVDFAGDVRVVETRLTFGRSADIEVDDNPYLHRVIGEFVHDGSLYWLRNVGGRIVLHLTVDDGHRASLPPGSSAALTPGTKGSVRFQAGRTTYEVDYRCGREVSLLPEPVTIDGDSTTQFVAVLTGREVDFLVTFAEPLLTGSGQPIPTYAQVARRWGVSQKTLDNTLQLWKQKLRSVELRTDVPLESLLSMMVDHGLLTGRDLTWAALDGPAPRPAAQGPRFNDLSELDGGAASGAVV